MLIQETQTWNDIHEIPALLDAFSRRAPAELPGRALKAADNSVQLIGRGSSDHAAIFAKYIWETYAGVRAESIHPHSIFEARRPLNFRGRAVWAFSQSGRSTDVVACLKKLQRWGARGVAVTNEADPRRNPLAAAAGRHILLSGSRELAVAATKSFSLQLWLAFWTARVWRGWPSLGELEAVPETIRSFLARPDGLPPAGRFARIWRRMRQAPVLAFVGRGPLFAVAMDAALKFREMAGVHAMAYSAADYLHGPVGAYGAKDFVFLLAPSADGIPADIALVRGALRRRGTPCAVLAPASGKPPLNALLLDAELKLAALALAVEKGRDPDRPKGLKKVTLTY
ncbi:MAG: SIS domain-containing protein [Elusimicrobia bacterium]|nr:SIS domain-containing protein [Elusimicrobiota bacterium]